MDVVWLCGFAFLAGLVDSVVGGGGLIQLPALLLFLPAPLAGAVPLVLGTNKLSSICGTGMAVAQYARRIQLRWAALLPGAAAALVCSGLGALTVSRLSSAFLRPLLLALLVAVAVYTFLRKDLGSRHVPRWSGWREQGLGIVFGAGIGFYDGFFGPGTGSFLILVFIGVFGFDFLRASASAKVLNFATNLSAVAYFAATDRILYAYALPMGLCNVLGSLVGTRLALWRGNRFVRGLFLLVISAMIARYGWEVLRDGLGLKPSPQ